MFGGLSSHKRNVEVVETFVDLLEQGCDIELVIAGHPDDPAVVARVDELVATSSAVAGRIHLELSPPGDRLQQLIADCDVIVSLRWPTTGELSGTLATAVAFGKPAIVSDLPQLREVPQGMRWFVPVPPGAERPRLRDVVRLIVNDRTVLRRATSIAEAHAASLCAEGLVDQYLECIEICLRRNPGSTSADRATRLDQGASVAPVGAAEVRGSGGR